MAGERKAAEAEKSCKPLDGFKIYPFYIETKNRRLQLLDLVRKALVTGVRRRRERQRARSFPAGVGRRPMIALLPLIIHSGSKK